MPRYNVLDNEHASGDPLALLARLVSAGTPTVQDKDDEDIWYCLYCGEDSDDVWDETNHAEDCPWRLAREYCDRFLST